MNALTRFFKAIAVPFVRIKEIHEAVLVIKQQTGKLTMQTQALLDAIAANAQAINDATARVIAKIAELGEPDPDLTDAIAKLNASTAQALSIAAPDTPFPGDPDYVPGPGENTVPTGDDGAEAPSPEVNDLPDTEAPTDGAELPPEEDISK